VIAYPDTSFLYALYRAQRNTHEAVRHALAMLEPIHISALLLFEFRHSTRWQAFLHAHDPSKGYDAGAGRAMLARLNANIASGGVIIVPVDYAAVMQVAESLSTRFAQRSGHRVLDTLHVATAVHFGAQEFLTFDTNQKKLAKAEGLKVPL
jgi:predicted nucleic acid-binding protein